MALLHPFLLLWWRAKFWASHGRQRKYSKNKQNSQTRSSHSAKWKWVGYALVIIGWIQWQVGLQQVKEKKRGRPNTRWVDNLGQLRGRPRTGWLAQREAQNGVVSSEGGPERRGQLRGKPRTAWSAQRQAQSGVVNSEGGLCPAVERRRLKMMMTHILITLRLNHLLCWSLFDWTTYSAWGVDKHVAGPMENFL